MAPVIAGLVLILLFVAFAREWRSPEVSAAAAAGVCLFLGLAQPDDLLEAVSNPAIVTIAGMFIMSAAVVRTGALDRFVKAFVWRAAKRPRAGVAGFLTLTSALSAFMNSTPLVMLMIPAATAFSERIKEASSRLLIPLSYAAILGGACTLIGTSANLLVDGVAQDKGLEPFSLFEIAPVGLAMAVAGLVFLSVARQMLPVRTAVGDLLSGGDAVRFLVEIAIEDDNPHIGKCPVDVGVFSRNDRRVVDVVRGDASLRREIRSCELKAGDIVVLRSPVAEILTMKESGVVKGLDDEEEAVSGVQALSTRKTAIVEILLAPGSSFIGRTLRHLRLRRRYGVYPMALHRRSENFDGKRFEGTRLQVGDTVLIEGAPEDLKRLIDDNDLVNVAEPSERPIRRWLAPIAMASFIGVVALAALGAMPIAALAAIGAAFVLATRCVEPDEAFEAVDWRLLCLIAAMITVGRAVENSGLLAMMIEAVTPLLSAAPPILALLLVYAMASILTELITNSAVAVLLTPAVIAVAQSLGLEPRPFAVAVMMAASASFMTPVGYQTNTLVYSVGGYRFSDYLRLGAPMNLITGLVAITIIPLIWPLS